jgi:hypothetical protein
MASSFSGSWGYPSCSLLALGPGDLRRWPEEKGRGTWSAPEKAPFRKVRQIALTS